MPGSLLRAIRRSVTVTVAVGAVALAAPATVSAQVVNFDDIATSTTCAAVSFVPNGYAGFNWLNVLTYNVAAEDMSCPLSFPGYAAGVVSPSNAIFNASLLTATISSDSPFTFTSGYFGAAWQDEQLTLTGSLDGSTVFTQVLDIFYEQPKLFTINSGPINSLSLSTNVNQFTADNLTFNANTVTTPEPSSMALLGTGLVGLVPMVRRRRRQN